MSSHAKRTRRPRVKSSLKRQVATREPKKTLVVWCEGSRTEPQYLAAIRALEEVRERAAVDIRLEDANKGAVPLTLVNQAVGAKMRADEEGGEVDEYWCVFDVEWPRNHPHLREALEVAGTNGVRLAVSNPCFELWLALHFAKHAAFATNAQARQLRESHDKDDRGKSIEASAYMPYRASAKIAAMELARYHEKNGTAFPHDNPSSSMYELLESAGA